MNYQIYPYDINKITNYEKGNYSPLPYLILKTSKEIIYLFIYLYGRRALYCIIYTLFFFRVLLVLGCCDSYSV